MATLGKRVHNSPLTARLTRLCFFQFGLGCITIAWVLILGIIYVYAKHIYPFLVDPHSVKGILFLIPSTWVSFNLIFNYAMVLWTSPGRPTTKMTDEERKEMQNEQAPQKGHGWSKYCKHCKVPKPPRTHHCHICGFCVLKMDHHCPWINKCVGHFNHRYFVLFIIYLAACCSFACLTIILHALGILSTDRGSLRDNSLFSLLFTFTICVSIAGAMCMFFAWNFYLIYTNQTTIEYHYNLGMEELMKSKGQVYANPYNVGLPSNLAQVFGPFQSWWGLTLPSVTKLPGDGTRWLTIHNLADHDLF